MESFSKLIGANTETIKETRVKNTVRNVEAVSRQKVEALKQEFRNMQSKLDDILDIGATNTQDIATHLKGFNATSFVNDVYPLVTKMCVTAREVTIAVNLHNSLFPTNKVDELDKEDLQFLNSLMTF